MANDNLLTALLATPRKRRLQTALLLTDTTTGELAKAIGVTPAHVRNAANNSGSFSLPVKMKVARALEVPASAIWPELQALAFELLHGLTAIRRR